MKLVTREEAEKFIIRTGRKSELRATLEAMNPGEIMHITKPELKVKRGPFEAVRRINRHKRKKYIIRTILNGGGWLVERVK